MNNQRRVGFGLLASVHLLFTMSLASGQDAAKVESFRDLVQPGDAVYLRAPADKAWYQIQLLSDEQSAAVKKQEQANTAKHKRVEKIGLALKMEHRLEQRAKLLLESDALESELSRARTITRLYSATYYEVTHVGTDYIALKRGGTERFIPFRSIQQMYRDDKADPTQLPSRRRSSGGGFLGGVPRGELLVQLQHIDPAEVADVIKKLFDEQELEIEPAGGAVRITFEGSVGRRIESLIQRLDVKLDE